MQFLPCLLLQMLGVVFFHLAQKHWVLAEAKAGDFDWGVSMLLLGLKPCGPCFPCGTLGCSWCLWAMCLVVVQQGDCVVLEMS